MLLAFRFALVVVWQGGFKITLTTWVVETFSSKWLLLRYVKRLTLSILGNMTDSIAERASMFTTTDAPPDVLLAFIRSRAAVVQQTWVENDVKMAADFQAVASAATTVTADFVWNYFSVGENVIKGSLQYKRGVLMIYVANVLTLFLAQALARRQLHSKVVKLKKDMSAAVAKIIALNETHSQFEKLVDEKRLSIISEPERRESVNGAKEDKLDDNEALNDLQSILNMTEAYIPQETQKQRRRESANDQNGESNSQQNYFEIVERSEPDDDGRHKSNIEDDDDDDDDWGVELDLASPLMQGYVKLQEPKSSKFNKRFVILSRCKRLLYYNSKGDVSDHVGDAKGILNSNDVARVHASDQNADFIEMNTRLGIYYMDAYTQKERREWLVVLSQNFVDRASQTASMEEGRAGDEDEEEDNFDFQSNPLVNRPRRNTVRRSSLGGDERADIVMLIDELPQQRGYLRKKNKFFWEERWFELNKNGTLAWYKSKNDIQNNVAPRGSLALKTVISVEQQERDGCLFNVDIKGRTYELQADSEGLAAEWSAALVLWVKHSMKMDEDEVEVDYGGVDEVKPLVSSIEVQYNEGVGHNRFTMSSRDSVSSDLSRDSEFRTRNTIHDHKNAFVPSASANAKRAKGRRSSLHMSLLAQANIVEQPASEVEVKEMHGWVKKKGATGGGWQRRWIEILHPGVLSWYATDTEALEGPKKAKGSFLMARILSVDLHPDDLRCFDVNIKGRTYEFQSYTEIEAKYWYDVVLAWMEQATLLELKVSPTRQMLTNSGVRGRPQRKGFLLKRGVGSTRWQSRWFTMTEPGVLRWYKNSKESLISVLKSKGSIQLADVLGLEQVAAKPTCFEIYVKGRTYELNASSEKEAQGWISDIYKWMAELDSDDAGVTKYTADSDELLAEVRESASALSRDSVMTAENDVAVAMGIEDMDTSFLPEKRGMVKKKGEKKSAKWQLRWLELTRSGYLAYYKDEGDSKHGARRAKGLIAMADVLSVELSDTTNAALFDVDVQGRTFQFEAETAIIAKEWYMALLLWVEHRVQKLAASKSERTGIVKAYRRCSVSKVPDGKENIDSDASGGPPVLEPARKRGILKKKGGSHGAWQERWCELGAPGMLCWYASQKDAAARGVGGASKAKGRIFLGDVISVDAAISPNESTCFDVDIKGRTYEFQASSADEARDWSASLSEWAAFAYSNRDRDVIPPVGTVTKILPDVPVVSNEQIIKAGVQTFEKSGTLKKQGGLFGKTWQSRFFVLRHDVLSWYASQSESLQGGDIAKGSIGVHEILSIGNEGCTPDCFDIDIQGRTISFRAADANEASAWMNILHHNSKYLENMDMFDSTMTNSPLSKLFSVIEGEEENKDENNIDAEVVPEVISRCPDVVQCMHDLVEVVELREVAFNKKIADDAAALQLKLQKVNERDNEEDKTGNEDIFETERDISMPRPSQEERVLIQNSLSILPKAWLPNASETSDSESSDDDDGYESADDEYASDEELLEGEDGLPRPISSASAPPPVRPLPSSPNKRPRARTSHTESSSQGEVVTRSRRCSDAADKAFVNTNAKTEEKNDNFLNKLKANSAGELNREFWQNHKRYLFHVMGFVTLHVLYVTSFVLKENDIESN